jgi:hypothetical protein
MKYEVKDERNNHRELKKKGSRNWLLKHMIEGKM